MLRRVVCSLRLRFAREGARVGRRSLPRSIVATVAAACVLQLAGCGDAAHPTAEQAPRFRISNSVLLLDSAWTSFALDAEVTLARFDSSGRPVVSRNLPVRYHLTRTLRADGQWATTMTFAPRIRGAVEPGTGRFEPEKFELGTITDAGDGTELQILNGLGQAVPRPSVPGPARQAVQHLAGRPYDRSWARLYILPVSGREARNARLIKLGTPVHVRGGFDRYTVQKDSVTRVLLVDPAIGVAIDVTDQRGGRPIRHVHITYAIDGEGNAVRTGMRMEMFGLGPAHQEVATTIAYSNVQLAKEG